MAAHIARRTSQRQRRASSARRLKQSGSWCPPHRIGRTASLAPSRYHMPAGTALKQSCSEPGVSRRFRRPAAIYPTSSLRPRPGCGFAHFLLFRPAPARTQQARFRRRARISGAADRQDVRRSDLGAVPGLRARRFGWRFFTGFALRAAVLELSPASACRRCSTPMRHAGGPQGCPVRPSARPGTTSPTRRLPGARGRRRGWCKTEKGAPPK